MARDPMEVLHRPAAPADRTLRYGAAGEHVIDLRLPHRGSGPFPLVVVVHGGFWRTAFDRGHAGPQASALAAEGFAVAVPEYRRVGGGGGWPGTFEDTAAWSDSVLDLVTDEVRTVDVERVVYVGHSAGAHLALWAASRHRLPATSSWHRRDPLPLRGVVALAGVCDLRLAAELDLSGGATQDLMGGDPGTVGDRYALGDPAGLAPTGLRTVLVHGTADRDVPIEVSRAYLARARTAGDPTELVELAATGHFEVIDPLSRAWPAVTAAIRSLL